VWARVHSFAIMQQHVLSQNMNVLYITLEMAEEEIAKRIDANLLDSDMHVLEQMPVTQYESKVDNFKKTCRGKLDHQ
jgi:hypothetical protein